MATVPRHEARDACTASLSGRHGTDAASGSVDRLVEDAYARLRQLAHGRMRRERRPGLLQTTVLVHEVYLRLIAQQTRSGCQFSVAQFLCAASEAMRRILIENARLPARLKHGGGRQHFELLETHQAAPGSGTPSLDLLALDEALEALRSIDERMYQVVLLRFFGGAEIDRIAEVLGVSARTVDRDWRCARVWLYDRMNGDRVGDVAPAGER
jgi:RNA polymerase sigma factor (TIGR02999 family)